MKTAKLAEELHQAFEKAAIEADATAMKQYLRNQFEFFGLKSKLRRDTQRAFWQKNAKPKEKELIELVKILWKQPYRELHYQAMELLERPVKKADTSWIDLLEYLITHQSWWDTVDLIASKLVGTLLKNHPTLLKKYPPQWIASDNMWLRRTAIIYQLKYKKQTNFERLTDYILLTASEKEFFIQKAAGWALREYSKTNATAVTDFMAEYEDQLSNLTVREGMKWLNRKS